MKNTNIVILATLLFLSLVTINGVAEDDEAAFLKALKYKYVSFEQVEKIRTKTVIEKFQFVEFNKDYDYDFTILKNEKNTLINMKGGANKENAFSKGEKVIVEWKITTLYEAAEGDAPYYYPVIVSIKKNN